MFRTHTHTQSNFYFQIKNAMAFNAMIMYYLILRFAFTLIVHVLSVNSMSSLHLSRSPSIFRCFLLLLIPCWFAKPCSAAADTNNSKISKWAKIPHIGHSAFGGWKTENRNLCSPRGDECLVINVASKENTMKRWHTYTVHTYPNTK